MSALNGCGSDAPATLPTIPVKGKLQVDGKPFGPANLSLVPIGTDESKPRQTVGGHANADGTFELRTYVDGDGAPEGKYTVRLMTDPINLKPVPIVKTFEVEIKKPASGNFMQLDLNLESTGTASAGGLPPPNAMPGMQTP